MLAKLLKFFSQFLNWLSKLYAGRVTLTDEGQTTWQKLERHLDWETGFSLIFVFYDDFSQKHNALTYFQNKLAVKYPDFTNNHFIPKIDTTPKRQDDKITSLVYQITNWILEKQTELELNQKESILWIDLHTTNYNQSTISAIFSRLNERRDTIKNTLTCPIIFVLAENDKNLIKTYAPDFWFVRNLVIYIDQSSITDTMSTSKLFDSLFSFIKILSLLSLLLIFLPYFLLSWFFDRFFLNTAAKLDVLFLSRLEFYRFHKTYHQQLIYSHRVFNVRGLRTQGTFTLEVERVFVSLRITRTNIQQVNFDPILSKNLEGSQEIWDFLRLDDLSVLAIIGAPGCGKTTLLQYLALAFAQNKQPKLSYSVPILLFLREHIENIKKGLSLEDLVAQYFEKRFPTLNSPKNWFQNQLRQGKCLVMLDGLDEVAEIEDRKKVSAWVSQQVQSYAKCRFVITSRPQGYKDAPIAEANMVLEVLPFSQAQIRRFVEQWYLANEVIGFGKEDEGVKQKAHAEAEDLLKRLQQTPNLKDLTVNPLLLTMVAMVHRYRGQLPGRRVELYGEICDVLLGFWQEAKGIQDNLTAHQKRAVLEPLAAYMMNNRLREIDTNKAMQVIRSPLNKVGVKGEYVHHFLHELQSSSGLFLENEVNSWRFAHLTFQEYLAALYFKDKQSKLDFRSLIDDSWWHESLRLYAALDDATYLVMACLEVNTIDALGLAADCLDEARQLDADIREKLELRLLAGLESEHAETFKMAAEVKLKRRLRNLQRIDEKREIDLQPISCAEYQLFLDEMREHKQFYHPEHWTSYRFAKGQADKPILGMQSDDAVRFCEWLQSKYNEKYRLPTLQELQEGQTKYTLYYQYNNVLKKSANDQLLTQLQTHSKLKLTLQDIESLLSNKELLIFQTMYAYLFFLLLGFLYSLITSAKQFDEHFFKKFKEEVNRFIKDFSQNFTRSTHNFTDFIRNSTNDITHDFARGFTHKFAHDFARGFTHEFAHEFAHKFAYDFAHDFTLDFANNSILDFIHNFNYKPFYNYNEKLKDELGNLFDFNKTVIVFSFKLSTILAWLDGEQTEQVRVSILNFMLSFSEQHYENLDRVKFNTENYLTKLMQADIRNIFREIKSCFAKDEFDEYKQKLRLFYVHTLLTKLRMEGKLEPWESIIIVREREE